ncbi:MAG TPA: GNAT family N-acetyltransferase [Thermoanaerobaculia bacterium]
MPQKPSFPQAPAPRPLAPHVQAIVAPAAQAKTPAQPAPGGRQPAAHVAAATQGRTSAPAAVKPTVTQAKPGGPPAPSQASPRSSFHIATTSVSDSARQIRISANGQRVGSVEVRVAGQDSVKVLNLEVDTSHRKQGAGIQLMRAAVTEGVRMGRSRVTLESQDNGTGKLTRWYQRMGFQPRGRSDRGMVVLEAPAGALRFNADF